MKVNLFDSGHIVGNISVVVLARNNSSYLPKLFQILSNLENTYEVRFDYLFIENGSTDNTLELLRDFMASRDGTVTIIGNSSKLDGLPRTVKMATLRNYAKAFVPAQSDWTMLIDTNIYFEKDLLEKLFKHQPTEKNIGMLCTFGTEVLPDEKSGDWFTQHHYYDTFAFVNLEKKLFWPHCIFESCVKCQNTPNSKIVATKLIHVHSAFGGIALIKTELIKEPRIIWQAFQQDQTWLCEHIGFCQNLQEVSGKLISIATDCPVYWDASTFGK